MVESNVFFAVEMFGGLRNVLPNVEVVESRGLVIQTKSQC
jgi:hypothetical protein